MVSGINHFVPDSIMNVDSTLTGKIFSGEGQAAFFTQLDWVREQCLTHLGFTPYPGTLNLVIADADADLLESFRQPEAMALIPPDPEFCRAQILPVTIRGIRGAIVIPARDVHVHATNVVEVIAPVCLKDVLGLHDGDVLKIVFMER